MVHGKEQLACAMVKFKTESCFKLIFYISNGSNECVVKEVTCRDEPAENIHHNPPPQAF